VSAASSERVVVVIGPSTPEIDATLVALGLAPFGDDSGNATVWLPAEKAARVSTVPLQLPEPTPTSGPLLMTIAEVATALGVGRSTVYDLIARGQLEIVHIGRAARIPSGALDGLVRGLRASGEQAAFRSVPSARLRSVGLAGLSQR
jgi:excisionase family DNA binding protein